MSNEQELDLRDWFAGHALEGLLAGPNAPKKSRTESSEQYANRVAEEAYLFADAMMRRRSENKPSEPGGVAFARRAHNPARRVFDRHAHDDCPPLNSAASPAITKNGPNGPA
jgi:hypothetical protein